MAFVEPLTYTMGTRQQEAATSVAVMVWNYFWLITIFNPGRATHPRCMVEVL